MKTGFLETYLRAFIRGGLVFFLSVSFFICGCSSFFITFVTRSIKDLGVSPDTVQGKISEPILPHTGLALLWVGHSTCIIQIEDKVIITDPIFTNTVGMIVKRRIEPGILPSSLKRVDYILISHLHFDHFSYGSLAMLPKSAVLILPPVGGEYTPEFGFSDYIELEPWKTYESDSLRITAVPVQHFNGRYGLDIAWLDEKTYVGFVIEYRGRTVFFAGDTGYNRELFREIGRRFDIDLALIPIAPVEPRSFMRRVHTDYAEALQVFDDLHAGIMIPIHYGTFSQGTDSSLAYARDRLSELVTERKLEEKVKILNIGQQIILAR